MTVLDLFEWISFGNSCKVAANGPKKNYLCLFQKIFQAGDQKVEIYQNMKVPKVCFFTVLVGCAKTPLAAFRLKPLISKVNNLWGKVKAFIWTWLLENPPMDCGDIWFNVCCPKWSAPYCNFVCFLHFTSKPKLEFDMKRQQFFPFWK